MLTIAAAVLALATTQSVPGARFESLAAPVEHAIKLVGDARLVQSSPIPNQIVPVGALTLKVHPAIVTPSYVNVPVEIDINRAFVRQVFVGYRVERFVETAIATHDLIAGAVISRDDVRMERVVSWGQTVNGTDALLGRKVVGNVRQGGAVTMEMTRTDQIVKAGQTVTLIVSDGGVSIVADVLANTSGGLGEQISLYNPQTHKMMTGTVVGPDRVELNLTGDVQ